MVLRKTGWRIVTLAVAVYAAASADEVAEALDSGFPMPPVSIPETADLPVARDPRTGGRLVWGGAAPVGRPDAYVPSPAVGDPPPAKRRAGSPARKSTRPAAVAAPEPAPAEALPEPLPEAERGPGDYGRTYRVQEARASGEAVPAASDPIARMIEQASLADPLPGVAGAYGARPEMEFDASEGLTDAEPEEPEIAPPVPQRRARPERRPLPSYASLSARAPPAAAIAPPQGALERETPSGYRPIAASEAMCRRELRKLGVRFTDISPIDTSRSCGIANPVRVSEAIPGIAMTPAATMNCQAALRVARWLQADVKPAARWKLWKRPTALINMSSYRCSRIAGSRTISEHASGNALDVGGFRFSDGSTMRISPKGAFSFRERAFQTAIRKGSCRYFGTVLGPGYNRAHADHLHLDVKSRLRPVCK